MPSQKKQATYADPLTKVRVDPFVGDVGRQAVDLGMQMQTKMNEISIRRAMQLGYMMACQDHGLDLPEFEDPAVEVLKDFS